MNDASAAPRPLGLFEAVGVEIEYAIVDQGDLSVRPIADRVLRDERGAPADEVEHGALAWSNELVRHMIELFLALSFDHRVVDGAEAARFLNTVIARLEDPDIILLES